MNEGTENQPTNGASGVAPATTGSPLFVFDVESIGLHGEAFAVAGGLYDRRGMALKEFAYHVSTDRVFGCDDDEQRRLDRCWVEQNVTINEKSLDVGMPCVLRRIFWREWKEAKSQGALMFVECGWPVEARFLNRCIEEIHGNNWNGPYPLHEIATLMLAAGMDPMASYERNADELPAHEPLADARLSARLAATAFSRLVNA